MTNPCVMPFVYLVMSSLLKFRINLPNASRAWETVVWLNGLISSTANSRHHPSTDLSDVRVSERPALTSPCFPSRGAGPQHQQLFSHCIYHPCLVVAFPPPLAQGGDAGLVAACVECQL